MSWQPEIDELRRREEMARRMGGPDKIKRQHDGGKLTVRERIERLLEVLRQHADAVFGEFRGRPLVEVLVSRFAR